MSKVLAEYEGYLQDTKWYAHANESNAKEMSYLTLGLVGESGEFADELKKVVRDIGFDDVTAFRTRVQDPHVRSKIIAELGDVLWYVTNLAHAMGADLPELMVSNTHKLHNRINDGEWAPKGFVSRWPFTDPFVHEERINEYMDAGVVDHD